MHYILTTLLIFLFSACAPKSEKPKKLELEPQLVIYNWEDYLSPDIIQSFEDSYGVDVLVETFDDEDRVIEDVNKCSSCYDIAVVSDDLVAKMRNRHLLSAIDLSLIPNFKNIGQSFLDPEFDPENSFSVPYLWGTTGMIVNTEHISNYEQSWNLLWNKDYTGKLAMLNNSGEVMAAALKRLRYSINSNKPSEVEEAFDELKKQKKLLLGYLSVTDIQEEIKEGNLWAAQIYSGEAMELVDENPNLEYFIPNEGSSKWVDNFIITSGARNKAAAHAFINYMLNAKVSAENANYLWYANCNVMAKRYTSKEILSSKSLYPSEDVLARCEFFDVSGDINVMKLRERMKARIWQSLLTGQAKAEAEEID